LIKQQSNGLQAGGNALGENFGHITTHFQASARNHGNPGIYEVGSPVLRDENVNGPEHASTHASVLKSWTTCMSRLQLQMKRRQFLAVICAVSALGSGVFVNRLAAQAPPIGKELLDYIEFSRKLGVKDDELRANAIKNGWKPNLVDAALKAQPGQEAPKSAHPEREDRGVPEEYIIGEADVLGVLVYKEPEASVSPVSVRADGKINVPLIKDVVVSGLTPAQAEKVITEKLTPFINDPDVSVVVREVHSKRIYLVGAVRKTGPVELRYPMTVLQAITEAGGPSEFAKRKQMFVRRTENGQTFQLKFDYDAVLRGEKPEQNLWLRPGDYIILPQ
jgi:polysaccharide export outer membrane protein